MNISTTRATTNSKYFGTRDGEASDSMTHDDDGMAKMKEKERQARGNSGLMVQKLEPQRKPKGGMEKSTNDPSSRTNQLMAAQLALNAGGRSKQQLSDSDEITKMREKERQVSRGVKVEKLSSPRKAQLKSSGNNTDDEDMPEAPELLEHRSSQMMAAQLVIDADEDEKARSAISSSSSEGDGEDADEMTKAKEKEKRSFAVGIVMEPAASTTKSTQYTPSTNSQSSTPAPTATSMERAETSGTVVPMAPSLDRATARTIPAEPGAMRVNPGFARNGSGDSNENLEYEDASEVGGRDDINPAGNTMSTRRNSEFAKQASKPAEIAAELIDEETDRKRLAEHLQDVLETQDAVHVVDVEAEDRLKRARQQRNMRIYLLVAIVLAAAVVVAVVVTVRNNATTLAPTEFPSMAPTMAPTSRLSAVQDAVVEGFGDLPEDPSSPQAKAINWLTNYDTTIKYPIEQHESEDEENYAQSYFNDRYAAAVFAFSTHFESWTDYTNWLNPDLSVCDGWKGLTCNDDGRVGVIDLAIHNLTGTIPTEIGIMDNLDFLFLFRNSLTGTLPSELGNLGDVDFFYLNENRLTGTLPPELSGLLDADDLFLFGNRLTGTIPDSFGDLVDLDNLYLQENELSGTIPTTFSNLKQIKRLYLNQNKFTGSIPSHLGGIISLERLLLQDNLLEGEIPAELGSFLGLKVLTLQNNSLIGPMPDEVCDLRNRTIDHLEVLEADCPENCDLSCCTNCW